MSRISLLKAAVQHPELAIGKVNCYVNHISNKKKYNPDGVDVFSEDWDNLIILDACRYNEFKSVSNLSGNLESRVSRGSTSKEFIRGNFMNKKLYETIYVSANGWFVNLKDKIDSEVHKFTMVDRDLMDGLTSHPETVRKAAISEHEKHPNKRLIVHFMQPHHPFIGDFSSKFDFQKGFVETVSKSDVSQQEIINAYKENLALALDEVELLLDEISGKSVVTADHGELLGDRMRPLPAKIYSHPEGVYVPELVKVPWLVQESTDRREITFEKPGQQAIDADHNKVQNHLEDLGYIV
ncbi:alkaline phosphatase family protein [Natronococcus occultus]|uniref:Sulfatase N-terminal domain-containing protein n=1 Tax=Natronococcus occultus SP4 TaxID=694430 RepID=L0K198_9EURY|nr:hypothetical protein [Natronococcus occultus]AGB38771.1 hypothetical protein Natoc_3024 [Natronococcus occultus SP4]